MLWFLNQASKNCATSRKLSLALFFPLNISLNQTFASSLTDMFFFLLIQNQKSEKQNQKAKNF